MTPLPSDRPVSALAGALQNGHARAPRFSATRTFFPPSPWCRPSTRAPGPTLSMSSTLER
jgi:hypothetical protein